MQHSSRFLNYTTDRVRRHQRLKVAEENIVPARLDQTNAVAVAVTFLNIDSDFAARVPGQHRKGDGPRAFDAKPRLSMSGFTEACVRRPPAQGAPAGALREAVAPYGCYNAASGLAKVRCPDADCERLIGVNVYGSGARLVITVAH